LRVTRRAVLAVLLLVAAGAAAIAFRHTGVRRVIDGQLLRSGQPGAEGLERAVKEHRIRSLVNLRGEDLRQAWYREEQATARRLGLAHWDVRLRMDEPPAQSEMRTLLKALDTAPRPLLLHCRAGVDRAGFAAAAARAAAGDALEDALSELSPLAGHVCWPPSCPLHGFFGEYRRWLSEERRPHSAEAFHKFVEQAYAPEPYRAQITVERAPEDGSVLAPGETIALRARVRNASRHVWPLSAGARGMRLGVRVLGPFAEYPDPQDAIERLRVPGMPEARDVARAGLEDGRVPAGDTHVFDAEWEMPQEPGRYVFQVDMVDEHVHWFSDMGGPGVLLRLEVAAAPPAAPPVEPASR
jgi:protein tyrosine phosphatase (PTP) superfamily phosphohydrolase (DUF442 family)